VVKKATKKARKKRIKKPDPLKNGRPSKLDKTLKTVALNLYAQGKTDKQVADICGVSEASINNYKKADPKFFESIKDAKADPDKEVEDALFKRAIGYDEPEQKFMSVSCGMNQGSYVETIDTIHHYPADVKAAEFWLKNRKPDTWREKKEVDLTVNNEFAAKIIKARNREKTLLGGDSEN
tara:strand:+ start:14020 stop:14559 length:540 start_codon:yes stop_codon:yes gene_type:complete